MPTVYEEPPITDPRNSLRNRIVGHAEVDPLELQANPNNWRIHPRQQQDAIRAILGQVGWVAPIIVNRNTGLIVDGHARAALAITNGEPTVPVDYVELNDAEEAEVIATFDVITTLAGADAEAVHNVLAEVDEAAREQPALQATLNRLPHLEDPDRTPSSGAHRENADPLDDDDEDDDEPEHRGAGDERRVYETPDHQCPHCGHAWNAQ
jgi:ParB-like chromosome segregation protein Spo0J